MTEGKAWKLEAEGLQLTVTVKGTEISDVRGGMVCFSPDDCLGEACNQPVPITALGRVGENIVSTLKKTAGVTGIRISEHMLTVRVTAAAYVAAVRRAIRQLMETYVCPNSAKPVARKPLARDIKAGRQPAPVRHIDYAPLGATT